MEVVASLLTAILSWLFLLHCAPLVFLVALSLVSSLDVLASPWMLFYWMMVILNFGMLPLSLLGDLQFRRRGIVAGVGARATVIRWNP